MVKAREKIETAMGEFDALKVEYWFGGEENVLTDSDQTFWFAPGAGLVKFRNTYETFLLRYSSAP